MFHEFFIMKKHFSIHFLKFLNFKLIMVELISMDHWMLFSKNFNKINKKDFTEFFYSQMVK